MNNVRNALENSNINFHQKTLLKMFREHFVLHIYPDFFLDFLENISRDSIGKYPKNFFINSLMDFLELVKDSSEIFLKIFSLRLPWEILPGISSRISLEMLLRTSLFHLEIPSGILQKSLHACFLGFFWKIIEKFQGIVWKFLIFFP